MSQLGVNPSPHHSQERICVHIDHISLFFLHELFHIPEASRQFLCISFILNSSPQPLVNLHGHEWVEQDKWEVSQILLDDLTVAVGEFQDGQLRRSLHDGIRAVMESEQLQKKRKVRFLAVEEDTGVLTISVDFPDHQFQKISIVSSVFFFTKIVFLLHKLLLVGLY